MPGVPRQGCSALKAADNAAGCMNCCFVPTLKLCGEVFLTHSVVSPAQTSRDSHERRIDISGSVLHSGEKIHRASDDGSVVIVDLTQVSCLPGL